MNEIEHEGKTYILKSQVESIIKERVSKVAQRATDAESQVSNLTKQIETFESKQASIDMLTEQITQLKSELNSSQNKFSRYQSMTKLGISEPELIDAIEWQYEKSMNGLTQKEKIPLNEWLENQIADVDNSPITIRPHLKSLTQSSSEVIDSAVQNHQEQASNNSFDTEAINENTTAKNQFNAIPPATNRNAIPAPEGKDILQRATDPDFYNQNYDAIRKAWMARYGN